MSWKSSRSRTESISLTEAEYIAASNVIRRLFGSRSSFELGVAPNYANSIDLIVMMME